MTFKEVSVREWVDLPFHMLKDNWKACILVYLREQYEGKVHKEFGGIRCINLIEEIVDNYIPPTLTVVKCLVSYKAEAFLPQEGEKYEGFVTSVLEFGVLIDHGPTVKTLIQKDHLKPYTFDGEKYVRKNSDKKIKKGTRIQYTVIKIQKTPQCIRCIALLGSKKPQSILGLEEKA